MQKENKNQRQGKIKVVAYSVIAKNQNRASNDYERQKLYYTEKIKANPEWEIVGVFIDDKTAENEAKKRVEFNKMLALCRRKKVDMIIVESASQFTRNTPELLRYTKELKDFGVDVCFEKQNLHTIASNGEYFAAKIENALNMHMGL